MEPVSEWNRGHPPRAGMEWRNEEWVDRERGLFGVVKRFLQHHDFKIRLAYGRPLCRLPFGISVLSTTNDRPILIASRHPRHSIVWTWALFWSGGMNFRLHLQREVVRHD